MTQCGSVRGPLGAEHAARTVEEGLEELGQQAELEGPLVLGFRGDRRVGFRDVEENSQVLNEVLPGVVVGVDRVSKKWKINHRYMCV